MNNRQIKIAIVVSLLIVISTALASAQTARYGGRTYTPQNFPTANWCNCSMCQNIRSQWAASTPVIQSEPVIQSQPVAKSTLRADDDNEFETRYREETKTVYETQYRTETYQRKVCTKGPLGRQYCYYVTDTRSVPYQVAVQKTVRVPYKVRKAPKPTPDPSIEVQKTDRPPDLIPTPMTAVRRLLSILNPTKNDVLIDAGCGDGRFVIEASKAYGCNAIGVEIDPDIYAVASRRIRDERSRARVFCGDALKWDYSSATMVVIYQMPDLVEDIAKKIPAGVKVASYMHDIPGIETKEYRFQLDGETKSIFVGVVGGMSKRHRSELTFGL